jgi:transketolase
MKNKKITSTEELKKISKEIRKDIIRSLAQAGSGHTGASLGLADVFTALYFNIMNHDSDNPKWEDRDRLILSIGHVAPLLYTTLAYAGYFDKAELMTLRKINSRLQGHPDKNKGVPGIELSAGSLGQGLSVAVGMALSGKLDNKSWRVFSINGDGEMQEGSIWEAAMSAAFYKLDNLTALIDRNHCQIDGKTYKVMEIEPLEDKWKAFGWNVIKCNGNNHSEIINAYGKAINYKGKPSVIIAETLMGKGVKSIEDNYKWHGKVPLKEQVNDFIRQIEEN